MDVSHRMRDFSTFKHTRGDWDTTPAAPRNALVRRLISLVSFKRALVDACARRCSRAGVVVDIGCGTGAYTVWFRGRAPGCRVFSVDWSYPALQRLCEQTNGDCQAVCADARHLPFRDGCADALFSVDTLGHVPEPARMLDEMARILRPGGVGALHSECADYRRRWPDRDLIAVLGEDVPALEDGHCSLMASGCIRTELERRFILERFFSPAGLLGWVCGYPAKYLPAFERARWRVPAALCRGAAALQRRPVARVLLRLFNVGTNYLELLLGWGGGGSCFGRFGARGGGQG